MISNYELFEIFLIMPQSLLNLFSSSIVFLVSLLLAPGRRLPDPVLEVVDAGEDLSVVAVVAADGQAVAGHTGHVPVVVTGLKKGSVVDSACALRTASYNTLNPKKPPESP